MVVVETVIFVALTVAAQGSSRVTLYHRHEVPKDWERRIRAPGDAVMSLSFALKQCNVQALEDKFWEVSSPDNAKYRQFLSSEEVMEIIQCPHVAKPLLAWLSQEVPLVHTENRGDAIFLEAISVKEVERLFETEIWFYVLHGETHKMTLLRSWGRCSMPRGVWAHIDFVEGLHELPPPKHMNCVTPKPGDICMIPQTLKSLYHLPKEPATGNATQMAVTFLGYPAYYPEDLEVFFTGMALPFQNVSKTFGPWTKLPFFMDEQSLDVQYLAAVGLGVENWYWTTTGYMCTFANDLFNHIRESMAPPDVVSMSWGWSEEDQCHWANCSTLGINNSRLYVNRVNVEFQKIGIQGVSMFGGSGDSGANGRTDSNCSDSTFHAFFPADSPFITAVGATEFVNPNIGFNNIPVCSNSSMNISCATGGREQAVSYQVSGFTSGGGFSKYAPRPAYQNQAVLRYLTRHADTLPPRGFFNSAGRAYPDVSALGENFLIVSETLLHGRHWTTISGTSAATPTWGGIAGILNDRARACSGKPLGFLNPLLYMIADGDQDAFSDITVGDNSCTEDGCAPNCKGFNATEGWDPVTGLGTPIFPKLWAAVERYVCPSRFAGVFV